MNENKFAGLTRGEIARNFIPPEQRDLLEIFFGRGVEGATERFVIFFVPSGLVKETLEAYQEIARRVVTEKLDKSGVQALRPQLVEKALAEIGD